MPRKKLAGGVGWSMGTPSDGDAAVRPAAAPAAKPFLRVEKRAKGKVVTLVGGLPLDAGDWDKLARELKNACGAGGRALPDGIELQGDHLARARAALSARGWNL